MSKSFVSIAGNFIRSFIKERPAALGVHTSVETAFDGDLSGSPYQTEHRITGDDTLGSPTTGYLDTPETSPHRDYMFVQSGHNESVSSNDGRTSAAVHFANLFHDGQGDAAIWRGKVFLNKTKADATSIWACPAGILINGQISAGVDHVYFNPLEWLLDDKGFDVAAVGGVFNLKRTVDTGGLGAFWNGLRVQSIGTKDVESFICGTGKFKVGADFTQGTYSQAAIALKSGQRIALNATGGTYNCASAGNDYIEHTTTGITGIHVVIGGASILQVTGNQVTSTQNINLPNGYKYKINGNIVVNARVTGWSVPTGTKTRSGFDPSTVSLQTLAEHLAALIEDLHNGATGKHGLIGS